MYRAGLLDYTKTYITGMYNNIKMHMHTKISHSQLWMWLRVQWYRWVSAVSSSAMWYKLQPCSVMWYELRPRGTTAHFCDPLHCKWDPGHWTHTFLQKWEFSGVENVFLPDLLLLVGVRWGRLGRGEGWGPCPCEPSTLKESFLLWGLCFSLLDIKIKLTILMILSHDDEDPKMKFHLR